MPEGEGNKEKFNPEESIDELASFIKKSEQDKNRREKRIEKSFSKIDKHLENIENMSNVEQGPKGNIESKNWLASEEDLKNIPDGNLKTFIGFTGGVDPEHLTATSILNSLDKLQDLVLNKKISRAEADKLVPRIHGQLRNLTERDQRKKIDSEERFVESMTEAQRKVKTEQISLELPAVNLNASFSERERQTEEQRTYVRSFLDSIENSNRDSHDFAISYITNALEASLDKMAPSVRDEVETRLSLHDCSELIRQANGWLQRDQEKVGYGFTISSAAEKAREWHHDLTRKKIEVLFRKSGEGGLVGLRVPEAWDKLQEAVFNYDKYVLLALEDQLDLLARNLKEDKGRNFNNMGINKAINWVKENEIFEFKKMTEEQKKQARKLKLQESDFNIFFKLKGLEKFDDELGKKIPSNFYTDSNGRRKEAVRNHIIKELGNNKNAEKSVQLAEKIAIATLETSVFNDAATGNDELSEIIYLKDWRKGRTEKGRNRGPEIHENLIPGFGKSWLRYIAENEIRDIEKINRVFKSEKVVAKIDNISEGSYSYYTALVLSRYSLLKGLLMNRTSEPFKIDKNALQSSVIFFLNADKPVLTKEEEERFGGRKTEAAVKYLKRKSDGPLRLRTLWLLGVVDSALSDEALNWDPTAFRELKKAATMEILSEEAGTFIAPSQWKWIAMKTGLAGRLALLTLYRINRDVLGSSPRRKK